MVKTKQGKARVGKFGLPADTDPIELADELKRGMTVKLLADLEELRGSDLRFRTG